MTIETRSMFSYGLHVDETNYIIYFNEGGSELQALLSFGTYDLKSFCEEIASKMSGVGILNYGCDYDLCERTIDLRADGLFSILIGSASGGSNFNTLAGFSREENYGEGDNYGDPINYGEDDLTGLTLYRSSKQAGCVYKPQFKLQSYIDSCHEVKKRFPAINKSTSGVTELISFGDDNYYSFNIKYATNRVLIKNQYLDKNPQGVEDLEKFMKYIINKRPITFYPDRDKLSESYLIEFVSGPNGSKGTGFRLKELRGATGYFETGTLKFRKLEN